MRKTERLLYILSLLRTHRRLRASELAKRCGVTERTIYRDIISISAANIPIYFDGGYKLLHDGFLPPSSFSTHETGFISSILKSPMFARGKPFSEMAGRIIDKIEKPDGKSGPTMNLAIDSVLTEKMADRKAISSIETAIQKKRVIEMDYLSLKGEKTKRSVAPYALALRKNAWYLIGYCYLKNEIRTFRLGRIEKVIMTRKEFDIPSDFSIENYFRSSWGVYKGKLTLFKVRFTGEAAVVIKTSRHHPDENIEELDGGDVIYNVAVSGKEEFIRWVMAFGGEAEILKPLSARQEIKGILESALRKYKS